MDDDIVLSWSVSNWITVVLMVVIGFAILSLAVQAIRAARRKQAEA